MSIALITLAFDIPLRPASLKLLLIKLADNANDEGVCWPSMKTLVRKCNMTDRTIQTALNSLEELGLVSRRMRPNMSTEYVLHLKDYVPENSSGGSRKKKISRPENSSGGRDAPPEISSGRNPRPVSPENSSGNPPKSTATLYMEEPSLEPSCEPSAGTHDFSLASLDIEFEEQFWPRVPNKQDKKRAQEQYRTARGKASLQVILAGVDQWAKRAAAESPKDAYKPATMTLAANWLARERWHDSVEEQITTPPSDPKEDARRNERDEAQLPRLWQSNKQLAAITQAFLEWRLAGMPDSWGPADRRIEIEMHHTRHGEPPPIKRPVLEKVCA